MKKKKPYRKLKRHPLLDPKICKQVEEAFRSIKENKKKK